MSIEGTPLKFSVIYFKTIETDASAAFSVADAFRCGLQLTDHLVVLVVHTSQKVDFPATPDKWFVQSSDFCYQMPSCSDVAYRGSRVTALERRKWTPCYPLRLIVYLFSRCTGCIDVHFSCTGLLCVLCSTYQC